MQIWVDADACPKVIKDILFRVAVRARVQTTLFANHTIYVPRTPFICFRQVNSGFDVADNEIVALAQRGDLVITSDIPLASDVIDKGCLALSPRGELFTEANIKQRLNMRDFLDTMRSSGIQTGGPPALNQKDRQNFANHLDRLLTANHQ